LVFERPREWRDVWNPGAPRARVLCWKHVRENKDMSSVILFAI
jgi:hypothetical protein